MSRIEKTLKRWKNSRQEVRTEELFPVLNLFFPDMWSYGSKTGSHVIKVTHPSLKGLPGYGPDGDFTIPTVGGQKVKNFYLKDIIDAVNIISHEEQQ